MEDSFTLDAWIIAGRQKHHRTRDHFGVESDLYVVLSEDVGPYPMYTPIHFVLEDLLRRLGLLENATRRQGSFSLDAIITGNSILIDSVLRRVQTGSFTIEARIGTVHTFTIDATIRALRTFTIDAFVI